MNDAPKVRLSLIEIVLPLLAVAGCFVAWQEAHAQYPSTIGWAHALTRPTLWVLLVGGVAWAAQQWKGRRFRGLIPAVTMGLGLLVLPIVERAAERHQEQAFLASAIPYLGTIEKVRGGRMAPGDYVGDSLPPALRATALSASFTRDSAGTVDAIFITQIRFGPRWTGWWYHDGSAPVPGDTAMLGGEYRVRPVAEYWYRIEQQR